MSPGAGGHDRPDGPAGPGEAGPTSTGETAPARSVVLYRCRTPTDYLCPCGAVARRLRKLGVEHRTERMSYRKGDRPEIVELTGQDRVPVLVDGSEIVHDSKRITEYLQWAYGRDRAGAGDSEAKPAG